MKPRTPKIAPTANLTSRRALSPRLQQLCRPGDRALLMYDSGLNYIAALAGCLYAGVVAVPVFAPDPLRVARTLPRLEAIVHDAQAELLMGTSSNLAWAGAMLGQISGLGQLVPSDEVDPASPRNGARHISTATRPPFCNTRRVRPACPRACLIRHGTVLANLAQMEQLLDVDDAIACTWLPVYHDMGLVGGIFQCWYSGRRNVMLSPLAFFQQPLRWLRAVSRLSRNDDRGPRFRLRSLRAQDQIRRSAPPRPELPATRAIRRRTGARCDDRAFRRGFRGLRRPSPRYSRPCYGMAEATLLISALPGGKRAAGAQL